MNNKNTLFIVSSGFDSEGFLYFFDPNKTSSVSVYKEYLIFQEWNLYELWFTFDTHENAKNALNIVIDQIDQSKLNNPKGVIKINELEGVKGTNGIISSSYNTSPKPWNS